MEGDGRSKRDNREVREKNYKVIETNRTTNEEVRFVSCVFKFEVGETIRA